MDNKNKFKQNDTRFNGMNISDSPFTLQEIDKIVSHGDVGNMSRGQDKMDLLVQEILDSEK